MAHPAEAALLTIISEEEANILTLDAERQALLDARGHGSMRSDVEFLMKVHDCTFGARNSNMLIRFAEIQLAILPAV